jgi:phage tail-like protein
VSGAGDRRPGQVSGYLRHLPAIYAAGDDAGGPSFLGRFLLAFEHVLTGLGDPAQPGLEERLEGIPLTDGIGGVERYFEPGFGFPSADDGRRAPAEFLDWLATWVGLRFRADLGEPAQREQLERELIAKAVPLYRLRGTREGLRQLLETYTRLGVTIEEFVAPFQLGVRSRLGVDTLLGGAAPQFFRVTVRFPASDPRGRARLQQLAVAVIDAEKPAHAHYELRIESNTMQLGVKGRSTLGVDTLLGEPPSA